MRSFKRIAWKILAFFGCVFLITELITEPYFQNEIYSYQDSAVRDTYAGSLDTLICGSSHAYRAIMPEVLDETLECSSYNLSCSMMTMYGKYDLLRREIARNPVDFVILDATYNSMTRNRDREGPEGDIYQLGRYRNFFTRTSYFFKTIRLDEYGRVYYDMLSRGVYAWKALCSDKETGTALQYKTRGFLPMGDAVAVQQPEVAAYHSVPLETSLDADCMDYMDKIISLCQARGITVFVIVTPISQAATVKFDDMDAMYQELDAFFAEYGVTFLDFNLYHEKQQLFPDASAYSDETHMSAEGAADFSVLLAHTIQRWRSGEGLSGDFYASYAEAEAAWLAADSP